MVKIRMMQLGRKKKHFYRIVVMDSRKKRDGRYIEKIGFYNPLDKKNSFQLDENRILYWIEKGGQPTSIVNCILKKHQKQQQNN